MVERKHEVTLYYISGGVFTIKAKVLDKRYVPREWFYDGVQHLVANTNLQVLVQFLSGYEPVWINAREEDLVEL